MKSKKLIRHGLFVRRLVQITITCPYLIQ